MTYTINLFILKSDLIHYPNAEFKLNHINTQNIIKITFNEFMDNKSMQKRKLHVNTKFAEFSFCGLVLTNWN